MRFFGFLWMIYFFWPPLGEARTWQLQLLSDGLCETSCVLREKRTVRRTGGKEVQVLFAGDLETEEGGDPVVWIFQHRLVSSAFAQWKINSPHSHLHQCCYFHPSFPLSHVAERAWTKDITDNNNERDRNAYTSLLFVSVYFSSIPAIINAAAAAKSFVHSKDVPNVHHHPPSSHAQ